MTAELKLIVVVLTILSGMLLSGCTNTLKVLDGASHACGNIHIEGYLTDTQGEVVVAKAPPEWTPEQVQAFCQPE